MSTLRPNRRDFLQRTSQTALSAASLSYFATLPRVSRAEAEGVSTVVRYQHDLEPFVRLLEETPRERVLEEVAARIRAGASYQQVLAALLCAAVRNVQPQPSVGFKFHAVLVVNSCHLASLHGPDEDRWLPIFWAIDHFKSSQADEARSSGWRMAPVDEAKVPPPHGAVAAFHQAMENWDVELADVATAAVVRSLPTNQIFELFAKYAARDFRSIGHKAIFLANAWRTLQVIGFENAEPVLRSLSFALLNHQGEPSPAGRDLAADRPWKENASLVESLPENWLDGQLDSGLTTTLIQTMQQQGAREAAQAATEAVTRGVAPQSVWDAVFLSAGELLMRQPGIVGLHGLTTANAVHYLYQTVQDETVRKQLLLQACAFNPLFRSSAQGRGRLAETTYDAWITQSVDKSPTLEDLTRQVSRDKLAASREVRAFLAQGGNPYDFIDEARRLIFLKGNNAHDYKYASAVLEDFTAVSPQFRNDFLALSVFNLRGSGDRNSQLVEKTKAALG